MLTWKLWHALRFPPEQHPVFQRAATMYVSRSHLRWLLQIILTYLLLCMTATLVWPLFIANSSLILLALMLTGNTIYATAWAASVSGIIAHERELATYDLLCLVPAGPLLIGWALCTGSMHRSSIFVGVGVLVRVILLAMVGALTIALIIPIIMSFTEWGRGGPEEMTRLLATFLFVMTIAVAFYIDHVQSIVLANLIGMLVPTFVTNRLNARLWAIGAVLLGQLSIYLLMLTLSFDVLPHLFWHLGLIGPLAGLIQAILLLLLFYTLRDRLIAGAWQLLNNRFNTDESETVLHIS